MGFLMLFWTDEQMEYHGYLYFVTILSVTISHDSFVS